MTPNKNPQIQTINIVCKVSDQFFAGFYDTSNNYLGTYSGYVPEFFPEDHYGDYVDLQIDITTGQITNWNKPTQKQLLNLINTKT